MRDRLNDPRLIGVAFIAAGFVVMVLGWYGAARIDHAPGQLPYLLSGGFGGLGLVVTGLALIALAEARRARQDLTTRLDRIGIALGMQSGPSTEPHAVAGNGHVLAGSTTYHRPNCRLIADRDDLAALQPGEATAKGLRPCRICEPRTVGV